MSKFVLRKIRNGRVKVNGKWFVPDDDVVWSDGRREMKYDGRLDGQRWAFAVYEKASPPMLALWGTEALFKAAGRKDSEDEDSPYRRLSQQRQPNVEDGIVHWAFWIEE